jgi:recombinational DNA repair protein (RecF pathway)
MQRSVGMKIPIVSNPKNPIDFNAVQDQSHVSELVQCYSADKQLLQQAIKDLEQRISYKTQKLANDKEVLKQLLDKLLSWDKQSD